MTARTMPVSAELVRLYADYLHAEYGDLDSDYVFVNLWGRPVGRPWTYAAVYDLVRRLRRRTGIDFDPHWMRHTAATRCCVTASGSRSSPSCWAHPRDRHRRDLRASHRRRRPAGAGKAGWFADRQVGW